MLENKITIVATVGVFAILSASVATAGSHEFNPNEFNKKELNGRSSYISGAVHNSDLADIGFHENRESGSVNPRASKTAAFDDPDGFIAAIGSDYGYVRLETEFGYHETNVKSLTGGSTNRAYTGVGGKIDMGTAMVNLAVEYSIDPGEFTQLGGSGKSSGFSITPYVTAGGGVVGVLGNINFANTNAGDPQDGVDNGMFLAPAIQGGAGLTIGLPMGVEVYGQYSEMLAYTYEYRGSNDIHIKTVSGGIRLNF
jgi:hypothetical protein